MTGLEFAMPGIGVFHLMFLPLVTSHSVTARCPSPFPLPASPRNEGQFLGAIGATGATGAIGATGATGLSTVALGEAGGVGCGLSRWLPGAQREHDFRGPARAVRLKHSAPLLVNASIHSGREHAALRREDERGCPCIRLSNLPGLTVNVCRPTSAAIRSGGKRPASRLPRRRRGAGSAQCIDAP